MIAQSLCFGFFSNFTEDLYIPEVSEVIYESGRGCKVLQCLNFIHCDSFNSELESSFRSLIYHFRKEVKDRKSIKCIVEPLFKNEARINDIEYCTINLPNTKMIMCCRYSKECIDNNVYQKFIFSLQYE